MLITQAIPALYGGVSQQPDAHRSPIQMEAMVNSWATIVDGIGKRAPTEHIAQLSTEALTDAYIHEMNRDTGNQFVVVITDGAVEVYDVATGERKGVSHTGDAFPEYLKVPAGKTAREVFSCVSVADYTFILNKSVVTKMGQLGDDRTAQPIDYFNVNRAPGEGGAHQWQYPPNPPQGQYMGVLQTFQDLPEEATEGHTYKIQSTAESGFTGYFVRRTQGTWIEVTAPNIVNSIDATTMPHALIRHADGTWTVGPFSWAPRRAGDEQTNPGPSFLGRTISDIFFASNRLGLTVDENAVHSRAGDFGNFWRMTALDLLEDDVVDVAATETKVTQLLFAVPMAGDVMLFSDQVQFRLDGGEYLTPSSVSLTPTTFYPASKTVRPAQLGSDVYFPSEEGGWARLLEYFVRDDSNSHDAADITSHVPRFIPRGIRGLTTNSAQDALFLNTDGAPNRVYHYRFHWAEDEKIQSAWGYWQFPEDARVLSLASMGEYLYLVIVREGATYLERIHLSLTATAPELDHQVFLDERTEVTGTYDYRVDRTFFQLPYRPDPDARSEYQLVRGYGWQAGDGGLVDPTGYQWSGDGTALSIPGNFGGLKGLFGRSYEQRWTFSRWFRTGRNGEPDLSGRLQIRTVSLYYSRAGYFKTEVSPYGGAPEVEHVAPAKLAEFTGKTLGSRELLIGKPAFDDGVYSFQVYGNAEDTVITITNDSHLGAWFTAAEVEFFWQKRARFG